MVNKHPESSFELGKNRRDLYDLLLELTRDSGIPSIMTTEIQQFATMFFRRIKAQMLEQHIFDRTFPGWSKKRNGVPTMVSCTSTVIYVSKTRRKCMKLTEIDHVHEKFNPGDGWRCWTSRCGMHPMAPGRRLWWTSKVHQVQKE